jgi:hypothetical protein
MLLKHRGLLCRHGVPHDYSALEDIKKYSSSLEENNEK